MCGRYALALSASQVRRLLEDDDMPVADFPDDDGAGAPRQSYNFAPGYHGIVYRADTPDWGAGPGPRSAAAAGEPEKPSDKPSDKPDTADGAPVGHVKYKLQSMKWGLVPFWTKRNPDYSSMMRTINCREDSLSTPGGMWTTMKARKRCIVVAQGFFEWLKTGPKDKLPHFVKRKDGHLMCFAGLWDCVQYEGSEEKTYTYTIITTDSNKQLKFLHDRMPVIFNPGSEKIKTWLYPGQHEWNRELQSLLRPFDGELEVYPVSKDVGKVGNNSPSFIIPLNSKENKFNIANFFANSQQKKGAEAKKETTAGPITAVKEESHEVKGSSQEKRKTAPTAGDSPPAKKAALTRKKISATQNEHRSPSKSKAPGSQKITKFFGNSA
ncbi:putative peptidase [Tolypocladium ophioglossoides CBS 100239]|uniref:Putative peptidase n=1 Tax=Tolypocladium ophioglossoides (strain CBS 100239) TaxID=1163406 RepID=A0A0L0N497_TOLOC|nr:putative peptidase [Tolypocladium ophioglossoides CBS 100239]